jgi:hypothetical protein
MPEASYEALAARGVIVPAEANEQREILVRLGVPVNAIVLPLRVHDNTAQEAQTFRDLALKNRWRRIIVVTSKYHLRRAGFAIRREMSGTGVEVEMHGTRYEKADPDRWWTTRSDLRWVLDEGAKLIAYELGLGAQAESLAPSPAQPHRRVPRPKPQASDRILPARGPFADGSSSKLTRWPSFSCSNAPSVTEVRWKNHSWPPSSRIKPNPRSLTKRLIVPFATSSLPPRAVAGQPCPR